MLRPLFALLPLLLGACAALEPACPLSMQAMISEALYFGTAKPQGSVSAQEWADFLAQEVTPRFPEGLTVWPAAGQWQGENRQIVREASYVLTLLHPDTLGAEGAVRAITQEYKRRFAQEAVLRVRGKTCVAF